MWNIHRHRVVAQNVEKMNELRWSWNWTAVEAKSLVDLYYPTAGASTKVVNHAKHKSEMRKELDKLFKEDAMTRGIDRVRG